MISFSFMILVAVNFVLLYAIQKSAKITNKTEIYKLVLLVSSYVFVIYADWRFALILAFLSVATWICAKTNKIKLGVVIAVVCLGLFKYANFFVESFAKLFTIDYNTLNIILPLGISFYTFSAIGYLVDVYRGKTEARNIVDVALYLSYFPKITSGPIQKSRDFFAQIQSKKAVGWDTFSNGIQIFAFGLFKKIVIADRLAIFVNQVYETPKAFNSATVALAVLAYSLQIYFDFSGYSDMAIGASEILGISLPRNFNLPYLSHNVTEFWKRWHITLSEWLMEYVYIPLGGNRKGKVRTYINLILTMLIGGIWHGASWTFVAWGAMHGIALVVHKGWMAITKSDKRSNTAAGKIISIILTFVFVSVCWIFFRAESISKAFVIISRIVEPCEGINQPYTWMFVATILLMIANLVAFIKSKDSNANNKKMNVSRVNGFYPIVDLSTLLGMICFFVFLGIIIGFASVEGSEFIYGKF